MAFGIDSGVTPQAGIYTAIIAGGLISALGGSRMQIGGPTGAFVVIVASIVAKFGTSGLAVVTLLAGGILVIMGVTGLGAAVKYIPRPVTIGFTNGIALLIASTQIGDFLGLKIAQMPSAFLPRMGVLFANLNTISFEALSLAVGTLTVILVLPRITKRIPGSIVAMIACTFLAAISGMSVATIGGKFGGIPAGVPRLTFPAFHVDLIVPLLPSAMTVAFLAAGVPLLQPRAVVPNFVPTSIPEHS
jgi:SulP family sulfate permease